MGPTCTGCFSEKEIPPGLHIVRNLQVYLFTSFGTHEVTSVEIRHVIWYIKRNFNIFEIKGANRFLDHLLVILMRYKAGA